MVDKEAIRIDWHKKDVDVMGKQHLEFSDSFVRITRTLI